MAYIDGFSLYYSLKGKAWRKYYWLDVNALARRLTRRAGSVEAVKYFTALVEPTGRDPDKRRRQAHYLAALRTRPETHIIYGRFKPRPRHCRTCGATWKSFEEKQTDVNIAMEILSDAYESRFDTMLLISRDGDLAGVLRRIKQDFPQLGIILACPPGRASPDLGRFATRSIHVTAQDFRLCQLPDQVTTESAKIVRRPSSWR